MRIAYVCTDPGIPVFGNKGASIHVQEMLRAFLCRGAEVTLLSPRIEGERPADLTPVQALALPPVPKGDATLRAQASLALNAEVARLLADLGPLDLIYERHALYAHAAMEFAEDAGLPGILEVNAPLIEEQARHRNLALPEAATHSARRAMTAAHAVAAVSPAVASHCRAFGAKALEVMPNAISPERFPPRPAPGGPFTVGFLGSLRPWHDVGTAIEALAILRRSLPEARLLIVGDGPERARLTALAQRLDIAAAVEFAGAMPASEVAGQLGRMHVGLAPYAASDGFYFSPLKLYEYMAAGLAVIASRVGHLSEVVAEGRTGLLTPPEDPQALAGALARFAGAPDLRAALGGEARRHVLAHHTWDGVAAQVLRLAAASQTVAA